MFGITVPVDASKLFSMIKMVKGDPYFFKMDFWCVLMMYIWFVVVVMWMNLLTLKEDRWLLDWRVMDLRWGLGKFFLNLLRMTVMFLILWGRESTSSSAIIRAVDGLQFKWSQHFVSILSLILCDDVLGYSYHPTCNRLAYRNGVTTAIAASCGTRGLFSQILDVLLHC